jgi:hypothetical protein
MIKMCSRCHLVKEDAAFSKGRVVCKICRAVVARHVRSTPDGRQAVHTANKRYCETLHGRAMHLLKDAQRRAEEKELHIDIDHAWILERLHTGVCEVTGLPFSIQSGSGKMPYSPSLDRIDCAKGYTTNNVRVVLWIVNVIANEWGLDAAAVVIDAMRAHILKRKGNQ